jgi:NAD(P)-dependent dehydrogenase (short-subunit alcohol dehydrogenase family)
MNNPSPPPEGGSASPSRTSQGRVVLITGATGALGSKAAHAFAARGQSLVLLGHNQNRLDDLAHDLNLPDERLFASVVDLRKAEAVRSTAEAVSVKFGGVHALVHLVGGRVGGKTLTEASAEDLEFMLGNHVWTTFHLFQSFAPQLSKNRWGRVIIVSKSTVPDPPGKEGIYTAAKAAQENLVLNLSAELKEYGVTANIIQVRAIDAQNKGTGTRPDEIVAAMMYLFSDEASKVSGARIPLY